MRKLAAPLLACLLLAAPAAASPVLPATLADVTVVGASMQACPGQGAVLKVAFLVPGAPGSFVLWADPETGRAVVAHYPAKAPRPDEIGTGRIDPTSGAFGAFQWQRYDPDNTPPVCKLLYPAVA